MATHGFPMDEDISPKKSANANIESDDNDLVPAFEPLAEMSPIEAERTESVGPNGMQRPHEVGDNREPHHVKAPAHNLEQAFSDNSYASSIEREPRPKMMRFCETKPINLSFSANVSRNS